MITTDFYPDIIGPNFEIKENIIWLTNYLESKKKVPKYFWQTRFDLKLKQDLKIPCLLKISKNLNHAVFNNEFKSKWAELTIQNVSELLKVEVKLNESSFEFKKGSVKQIQYCAQITLEAVNGYPKEINSYFSVTLHQDQKICLIDDFYPNLYYYGWGGSGKAILNCLERFLRYYSPFKINLIYVCSITETYGFWNKMGYVMAPDNNWGSQVKSI